MNTASLSATLRDEQQTMTDLLEVMKQEQQKLLGADIDGLTALTAEKNQLVTRMAALAGRRHLGLGAAGFAAAEAGMDGWLASAGDPAASALWRRLLDLTREAKEINRINGMLINKQLANNQGALNALRSPSQGSTNLYGPSGQATNTPSSRRFVIG